MSEYASAVDLAKRLLTKKGEVVTLRSLAAVAPTDPDKPWRPGTNTNVDVSVRACFFNYEQKYIDGTLVQRGDQKVYMPATSTTDAAIAPEVEGLILRGAEVWKIVSISPLNPGGTVVMYELQVRR